MRLCPTGPNQQSDHGGTVFDTLLQQGTRGRGGGTSTLGVCIPALTGLGITLLEHGAVVTVDLVTRLWIGPKFAAFPYLMSTPNYLFLPTVIDKCGPEGIYMLRAHGSRLV